MQVSRIEQKIEDIYAFIESCRMQHLSTTKVVVPKNELYDLLDDLRRDVPDEIRRYQKILSQRDAIIEDAEAKANEILVDAREQYRGMVEEHSIMQQAYQQAEQMVQQAARKAEEIVANAKRQADEIGSGAIYYTTDMLDMAEKVIASAYENATSNSNALEAALRNYLETIRQNKAELMASNPSARNKEQINMPLSDSGFKDGGDGY
ncbi:MAG TPA: ATPase [Lachnospiraceae bacterium]|nr:ATPase [Lachnospiraceae bacterium]